MCIRQIFEIAHSVCLCPLFYVRSRLCSGDAASSTKRGIEELIHATLWTYWHSSKPVCGLHVFLVPAWLEGSMGTLSLSMRLPNHFILLEKCFFISKTINLCWKDRCKNPISIRNWSVSDLPKSTKSSSYAWSLLRGSLKHGPSHPWKLASLSQPPWVVFSRLHFAIWCNKYM